MAMARLCANLNRARDIDEYAKHFRFRAFIVDHGVRPNSFDEATSVKKQLLSWGMLFDPFLVDCWLMQIRAECQYFGRKVAYKWRYTASIELRDRGAKTTLSGFG